MCWSTLLMNKLYTFTVLAVSLFFLFSFSINPPDGNTGAPGDMLCTQCHIQTDPPQNGTISLDGFPQTITPHQSYLLTVTNRLTEGSAVRAGFQVTILGPGNVKAGELTNPSTHSAVSITGARQYWDHNPAQEYPDSNVVKWQVQWTAPELPNGSQITWYAAGNIADGDFTNTRDRIVTSTGSGSVIISATEDVTKNKPVVFPNPGNDQINFIIGQEVLNGTVEFYE